MRVLIFHPVMLPVAHYGGVERVVLWLAKGLVELGCSVTVAALKGSVLPDNLGLIEIDPSDCSAEVLLRDKNKFSDFDIIHFMAPPEQVVQETLKTNWLVTVHGNGKPGEIFSRNCIFLSRDHAKRHGSNVFVYNGVDPDEYKLGRNFGDRENLLFLSKTSWRVKNLSGAMKISKKAGVKLSIAGGNRPILRKFISAMCPSFYDWYGSVGGQKKTELLETSGGLLFPIIWDEPFGLVMVEALLSGMPVFSVNRGSVSEVVLPSQGIVANSLAQLGEKVSELTGGKNSCKQWNSSWNSSHLRDETLSRFHYKVMAQNYLNLFQKRINGETLL